MTSNAVLFHLDTYIYKRQMYQGPLIGTNLPFRLIQQQHPQKKIALLACSSYWSFWITSTTEMVRSPKICRWSDLVVKPSQITIGTCLVHSISLETFFEEMPHNVRMNKPCDSIHFIIGRCNVMAFQNSICCKNFKRWLRPNSKWRWYDRRCQRKIPKVGNLAVGIIPSAHHVIGISSTARRWCL